MKKNGFTLLEMIVSITLVAMIAVSGASHLIRKLTNTRAIFNLKFQDKDIFCLYNSKTKRIVSFLTKEQIMEG